MIGTVFEARYRMQALLGKGSLGQVYRATALEKGTEVAIKLIASDPPPLVFEDELRMIQTFDHRGVAKVLEARRSSAGQWFVVTEYLKGASLETVLAQGRMPAARALSITRDICEAIGEAHERGLLHRNLKPSNVFVTAEEIKILDFGFLPAAGGTPGYAAPEQIAGLPADRRCDLYAAGAILFECLATRKFSDIAAPAELLGKLGIDPEVAQLVLSMLARAAAERPRNIDAVGKMLDWWVEETTARTHGARSENKATQPNVIPDLSTVPWTPGPPIVDAKTVLEPPKPAAEVMRQSSDTAPSAVAVSDADAVPVPADSTRAFDATATERDLSKSRAEQALRAARSTAAPVPVSSPPPVPAPARGPDAGLTLKDYDSPSEGDTSHLSRQGSDALESLAGELHRLRAEARRERSWAMAIVALGISMMLMTLAAWVYHGATIGR